jgi:ERF superfamily
VMGELDYIQKGQKTVNGQYRFVSHDQVTAAIHPLLVKHGLVVIPSVEKCNQNGNMTEINLATSFINAANPTDHFTIRTIGYGIDGGGTNKDGRAIPVGDKGPGKAVSYAYKYALLKTFCLETGDDPDNDANACYEPAKCLEFDSALPDDLTEKDLAKLDKFLLYSAAQTGKHVEDLKREAINKMPGFLAAFKKWSPKSKE